MAVFNPGGGGNILVATGTSVKIFAGPGEAPHWLTGISAGYVPNPGQTPTSPPPSAGLTPGGVGTNASSDLSGAPSGTACTGCQTCGCLAGSERVMLYDGGCKFANEVAVGDRLLTISTATEKMCDTVVDVFSMVQPTVEILHASGRFTCSTSHRMVLADGSDAAVSQLRAGDLLVGDDGAGVEILAIVPTGEGMVYGWTCEPSHTFVACGLVHHNKYGDQAGQIWGGGLSGAIQP